jgi:autotransporter passenger strand-loop-strand repeat protein
VNSDGEQTVTDTAISTVVNGGSEDVEGGGTASGTVLNGGAQIVTGNGTVIGTVVNSGAYQVVAANGTASGTVVNSGGNLYLEGGAVAADFTISAGGTLTIDTQCLRCAGAPRRPAGGSGLSLTIPSWHADIGLRRDLSSSALPILPQPVSRGARISGLPDSRICYGLPSCSLPCTDQTDALGPRQLLLPALDLHRQ